MAKVSDIYTLYLKPNHLPEQGNKEATIEQATLETLHPRPGQTIRAIVLSFAGKPHKLILNQGNANRMASLAGDDFSKWSGQTIGLKRGKWGSQDTIIIEPVSHNGHNGRKSNE